MAMQPRHVLCLLGRFGGFDAIASVVARADGFELDREYSRLEPDDRMMRAFDAAADRVTPSMQSTDWDAVREHASVCYVLSPPVTPEHARRTARQALSLVVDALDAGATAVKHESSGIAHGVARWRALAAEAGSVEPFTAEIALYEAFVRRPLGEPDSFYSSCGMHLLGEPDVAIEGSVGELEALSWIDALALYLLTEKPPSGVGDGHTFRRREEDPRRVIRAQPCTFYEEDELFFNPYGLLRLEPPA